MNAWSSLAVLLGLAAAAGKLPSALTPLIPLPSPFEPVRRVELPPGTVSAEVDPEAREIAMQVKPRVEVLVNPVMGRILDASRTSRDQARTAAAAKAAAAGRLAARAAVSAASLLTAGGALCLVAGVKGPARVLAAWGFTLSRAWIAVFSAAGTLLFCGPGINAWTAGPAALWSVPLGGLLANAAVLKGVDLNHPVWNRLLGSLLTPLAAAAFMYFWGRAVGRPLV